MSYLLHLKKTSNESDTRWIVKYNKKGLVKEVKQVYKPSEYYAMNALIKILEDDKAKRS